MTPLPSGVPATPNTVMQATGSLGGSAEFVPLMVEVFKDAKAIFKQNPSEVFTKGTGGEQFGFMRQRGLEEAIQRLGADLHSQYMLSYNPNNNKDEGGFHEIIGGGRRPQGRERAHAAGILAGSKVRTACSRARLRNRLVPRLRSDLVPSRDRQGAVRFRCGRWLRPTLRRPDPPSYPNSACAPPGRLRIRRGKAHQARWPEPRTAYSKRPVKWDRPRAKGSSGGTPGLHRNRPT